MEREKSRKMREKYKQYLVFNVKSEESQKSLGGL